MKWLKELLKEDSLELVNSAHAELEKLAKDDQNPYISKLAAEALKFPEQIDAKSDEEQKVGNSVVSFGGKVRGSILSQEKESHKAEKIKSEQLSRPLRVFFLHYSGDKTTVQNLYQRLRAEGWMDIWLDEGKGLPSYNRDSEIIRALDSTDAVIVTFSGSGFASSKKEASQKVNLLDLILRKLEGSNFLLPVRLDNCELPPKLHGQSVDYFPAENYQYAYERLLVRLLNRADALGLLMNTDTNNELKQITQILISSKLTDQEKATRLVKLFLDNFRPKRIELRRKQEDELISSYGKDRAELNSKHRNAEKEIENQEFEKFKHRVFSSIAISNVKTSEFNGLLERARMVQSNK